MSASAPRTSNRRSRPSASGSPRWSGCPATTSCGRTAATRSGCAARSATSIWWRPAAGSAFSRRKIRTRPGTATTGPVLVVPLFVCYDYSFRPDGAATKADGLELAYAVGRGEYRRAMAASRPVPEPGGVVRRPAGQRRSDGSPSCRRRCRQCWSTTSRSCASRRRCCATRRSLSGAGPCGRRTGQRATGPARWSTGTCTSRVPRGTTASGTRRSRSAIRGSGSGGKQHRSSRARSCPPLALNEPDADKPGAQARADKPVRSRCEMLAAVSRDLDI